MRMAVSAMRMIVTTVVDPRGIAAAAAVESVGETVIVLVLSSIVLA